MCGQLKNWEIIENVRKILPGDGSQKREVSGQNRRVGISVVFSSPRVGISVMLLHC